MNLALQTGSVKWHFNCMIASLKNSKQQKPIWWPHTARELEDQDDILPPDLKKILTTLITGHESDSNTAKVNPLVLSLGQDLCRPVTNGIWTLPKHILLCMTLRLMFRSAELITLISRLDHSANYSYSLELETALATMVQQSSNMLTSQIIRNPASNSLFHSDFDNFDKFTATGSVHTSHGIMLQEVEPTTYLSNIDYTRHQQIMQIW